MKLYVGLSAHGFGHLAQTAPVLHALRTRRPDLSLVIHSALPKAVIAARVGSPFEHIGEAVDTGFVMHDSVRIDAEASLAAWTAFHRDWPARVAAEAERLSKLGVDAVLANVGYLPLAAARWASIPGIGLCSLNWADLYAHYFGSRPECALALAETRAAYADAALFLRPAPAMPMPDLPHARAIGPIAARGQKRRAELLARLDLAPHTRLVLVGLGGISHRLPMARWPRLPSVVWLTPDEWGQPHPDARPFSATELSFLDLLASCDALLTKPGYGSFVEAAVHGVAVLCLPRPDWPESPYLIDWLRDNGRLALIKPKAVQRGNIAPALAALWAMPSPPCPHANGAEEAADQILALAGR